jgi:hypothetical protein
METIFSKYISIETVQEYVRGPMADFRYPSRKDIASAGPMLLTQKSGCYNDNTFGAVLQV